jgi:hypothetical protein
MPLFELSRGILASHGLSIAIDTSNSRRFKKALKELDFSDNERKRHGQSINDAVKWPHGGAYPGLS